MTTLFAPFVNFFLFVGFLGYKLRGPLRDYVRNRHETTRDLLVKAQKDLKESQAKFDEFSNKLGALNTEIDLIRKQAREDAAAVKVKLINDAKKLSDVIVADAQGSAAGMHNEFKGAMARELAEQVMARVEKELTEKLSTEQKKKFRTGFAEDLKRSS